MEPFVILVLIVVAGMGLSAAAQAGKRKPIKDAWRGAASTLQLGLDPGDFFSHPEIHGEMRGHSVRVTTFTKGDDSARHTRYRVIFASSLRLGLSVRERTILSGVQRLYRKRELSFGDTELEERLIIRALARDAVVSMLGPVRRHALRDFYALFPGAVIDDTTITWEIDGVEDRRDQIVQDVRSLVKMAEELEQWVREPEPRPLPAVDETTTEVFEPTVEPERLSEETEGADAGVSEGAQSLSIDELLDPGWIPPRLSERDETEMAEELGVEADAVIEEPEPVTDGEQTVRLHINTDHAVLEMSPPADAATPPAEEKTTTVLPPLSSPVTAKPAEPDAPIHPDDVSRLLFGTRLMGDEMERQFAESFEGRRVLWPGTLRSVSTYPFDHIFGSERGARATFEIAELRDTYGARRVRAVVQLPEALTKTLLPRMGQRLLFEGTLFRCEAFMRTLYLLDGSVPEVMPSPSSKPTARPARPGPTHRSAPQHRGRAG